MKKLAVAVMMLGMLISSVHAQSQDPKAQQRRDAKQIDDQYERARKGSNWSLSPKPLADPWQSVKSPPPTEKK